MKNATVKPSAVIAYDQQTAQHAADSVNGDLLLLADAKRMGGIANKQWRLSFMVGTIAAIAGKPLTYACDILTKAAPDSKGKPKRTATEQKIYNAAKVRLSRFCKTHSITPANKARGKPKAAEEKAADATPKANNAKAADNYLRQQAATMAAYAEKNKAMLSNAWLHAIAEFAEAAAAILPQD